MRISIKVLHGQALPGCFFGVAWFHQKPAFQDVSDVRLCYLQEITIEFAGDKAGAVPQCLQERGHPYGVGPQGVMKKFGEM